LKTATQGKVEGVSFQVKSQGIAAMNKADTLTVSTANTSQQLHVSCHWAKWQQSKQ